jgi:glycosyltransferase involved in cell wall biosynthesis
VTAPHSLLVVIPVYEHHRPIARLLPKLLAHGVPVLLVDDGSGDECAASLRALADATPAQVSLLRLPCNEGKGGAVIAGLREAYRRGFTHALQIDADGQHDPAQVPEFVAASRAAPAAVVSGRPVYDDSVPRGRLYGRYLTHVWVWINTLSFDIADSMCGYRVYPLAPVQALLERVRVGRRMDFDTEILVRLHWAGTAVRTLPTKVTYPEDGLSHFRLWRDNVLISAMHARLFVGMLWRSPWLLARKLR